MRFLASSLLVGAMAGCAASPAAAPPSSPSWLLRRQLPSFWRETVAGGKLDTAALRGRRVVVKFFAAYCVPCQKTLPAAEKLHRELSDVAFVGISEDELVASAQKQIDAYHLTFPVVHDRGQVLAGRFRVSELPIAFVADETGRIVWVGGPEHDHEDLGRALRALVK